MHPRIEYLYKLIKNVSQSDRENVELLHFLKMAGATRTEATVTLHLGFNIDIDKADEFVIKSQVWSPENPTEVFYQTLKYVYYNPDDPNYEADDNGVTVSI